MFEVLKGTDGLSHLFPLKNELTQPSTYYSLIYNRARNMVIKKKFLKGLGWREIFKSTKIDSEKISQLLFPNIRINFTIRKTTRMYGNNRMVGNLISTKYQSNRYRSE